MTKIQFSCKYCIVSNIQLIQIIIYSPIKSDQTISDIQIRKNLRIAEFCPFLFSMQNKSTEQNT